MATGRRILGAIIAGGQSRRFGSDKALAMIDDRPMIAHIVEALTPQVDAIVICGRTWLDYPALPDRRTGYIGPLAGLEAALHHAAGQGFHAVVSTPVDTLPLPGDFVERLQGDGPAVFERQFLIGYWPVGCLGRLDALLSSGKDRVRDWLNISTPRIVREPIAIGNINRPRDLRPSPPADPPARRWQRS